MLDFHIGEIQHSTPWDRVPHHWATLPDVSAQPYGTNSNNRMSNEDQQPNDALQYPRRTENSSPQFYPHPLAPWFSPDKHFLVLVNNLNVEGGCYSRINTCEMYKRHVADWNRQVDVRPPSVHKLSGYMKLTPNLYYTVEILWYKKINTETRKWTVFFSAASSHAAKI